MFQSGSYYNEFFCTTGFTCEVLSQCSNVDECQVYVRRQGISGASFAYAETCADSSTCVYHLCSAATQTGMRVALDANLENTRHCLHQHWFIRIAVILLSVLFLLVFCCCLAYSCFQRMEPRPVYAPRAPGSISGPRYDYRKYDPTPSQPSQPSQPSLPPSVYRTWQVTRHSAA